MSFYYIINTSAPLRPLLTHRLRSVGAHIINEKFLFIAHGLANTCHIPTRLWSVFDIHRRCLRFVHNKHRTHIQIETIAQHLEHLGSVCVWGLRPCRVVGMSSSFLRDALCELCCFTLSWNTCNCGVVKHENAAGTRETETQSYSPHPVLGFCYKAEYERKDHNLFRNLTIKRTSAITVSTMILLYNFIYVLYIIFKYIKE